MNLKEYSEKYSKMMLCTGSAGISLLSRQVMEKLAENARVVEMEKMDPTDTYYLIDDTDGTNTIYDISEQLSAIVNIPDVFRDLCKHDYRLEWELSKCKLEYRSQMKKNINQKKERRVLLKQPDRNR